MAFFRDWWAEFGPGAKVRAEIRLTQMNFVPGRISGDISARAETPPEFWTGPNVRAEILASHCMIEKSDFFIFV